MLDKGLVSSTPEDRLWMPASENPGLHRQPKQQVDLRVYLAQRGRKKGTLKAINIDEKNNTAANCQVRAFEIYTDGCDTIRDDNSS